jgi:hypothetical protein
MIAVRLSDQDRLKLRSESRCFEASLVRPRVFDLGCHQSGEVKTRESQVGDKIKQYCRSSLETGTFVTNA